VAELRHWRRWRRWVLGGAVIAVAAAAGLWWFLQPRHTAAERGRAVAARMGCYGCHGPGGRGGIVNPGSEERRIPGFVGGTTMMYVESPAEVREWILDGRPARLEESPAGPKALIHMPAYRGRLSEDELDDLVAWYGAVAGYQPDMPPAAAEGRRAARALGCVGCHGDGGRLGHANPGSLKGYTPGWGGPDMRELARDEAEIRAWIQDGFPPRLQSNPIARALRDRQLIEMPAYRGRVSPAQLDALVAYIRWLSTL